MKQVIIINGSGASGKDTFVSYCKSYTNVLNISSVDKVKEAAKILVNWNGEKDEKSRKLLVDLKKLSIKYNDAPLNYIKEEYNSFINSNNNLMFIHIREIKEIKKVKRLLKAKTLLITNKNVPIITSNNSDKNVLNYEYDYTINNDGTLEELDAKAKEFITKLELNS